MSAAEVLATAPPGSIVYFSDGQARPPERFRRKLRAWEHTNGSGLLTLKRQESRMGSHVSPAHFSLRTGVYGSGGVTTLIVNPIFDLSPRLAFPTEAAVAGLVQVVAGYGDGLELRHLAQDNAEATSGLQAHGNRDARLLQIQEGGDSIELPKAA
jgi:hypothetical protein